MTLRVPVKPDLLYWAMRRSGRMPEELSRRFKKLEDWLEGQGQPTLRQLEDFARATHTPIGYFFLAEPPEETLPIPDFRTTPEARHRPPSADLLETIYICQQRQAGIGSLSGYMANRRLPLWARRPFRMHRKRWPLGCANNSGSISKPGPE
nr:hypothetical protein [Rhodothermus marinus]